jgi:hypothetical protein
VTVEWARAQILTGSSLDWHIAGCALRHDDGVSATVTGEPLTEAELDELEQLIRATSPAPWQACLGSTVRQDFIELGSDDEFHPNMYVEHDDTPAPSADLEFIAAARNYLPRLLTEVRRTRSNSRR